MSSTLAPGLLVAAPPLGDPNFERSVVLLAAHGEDGAFGWVLNGAEIMSMSELLERTDVRSAPNISVPGSVRAGGPVSTDQVWLLYRTEHKPAGVAEQFDIPGSGITASSSRLLLELMATGNAPKPLVGVAGYAGWGPSQLENEIGQGAWLPMDVHSSLVFAQDPTRMWLGAFESSGTSAIAFSSRVVGSA
ncbi:MAG TPA: YqgE/AlgH family protein [Polyangiaceae bacterium]|jgi:putative transcriptional regulator|nr:YqgE/AlgH family protein [Polyangiaceae bacterium]